MATKSEIVEAEAVVQITGVNKAEAHQAIDAVFVTIADKLARGEDVRLTGFASISVANSSECTGRNPQTGQTIRIPATKQPKFKADEALKDALKTSRRCVT